MPLTVERLNAVFPQGNDYGDFARFEYDSAIQRFTGEVISHEFIGLAVPERQKRIWDRLRESFGEEAQEVSLVLAFSPIEWEEVGDRAAS